MNDILHQRLIRRAQRHATRQRLAALEDRARITDVALQALHGQVASHSLLLGTAKAPEPGVITRETRLADEAAFTALAGRNWNLAERLALAALMPAPELEPAMADPRPVYTCPKCRAMSSNGCCPRGCPS